jgi:hypothetical protein
MQLYLLNLLMLQMLLVEPCMAQTSRRCSLFVWGGVGVCGGVHDSTHDMLQTLPDNTYSTMDDIK